eukprot:13539801-Alexandrium_andersonii.AAC.1
MHWQSNRAAGCHLVRVLNPVPCESSAPQDPSPTARSALPPFPRPPRPPQAGERKKGRKLLPPQLQSAFALLPE